MKFFLKKVIVTGILIGMLSLMLLLTVLHVCSKDSLFTLPKEINAVILGHSHSACAFEDSLFEGTINLSQPTEGYPYSYFKAKKLLEVNDHIKTIYIEYTNNQISKWALERIHGEYLPRNMPRMAAVMDKRYILKTLYRSGNLHDISEAVTQSYQDGLRFVMNKKVSYIEHFWHNHKTPSHVFSSDSTQMTGPKSDHFVDTYTITRENVVYLFKLKELCAEYEVELIFVRSPLPRHVVTSNEKTFMDIKNTFFPEVSFLDFKDFPLELKYFSDNQHLNRYGGIVFSNYFNEHILSK